MASQEEIMNRAFRIANMAGIDAHASQVVDSLVLTEDLFTLALRAAVRESPKSNKRSYALVLVAGEVALPDTVLDEALEDSTLVVDSTLLASYEPRYEDFIRAGYGYSQIAYYTTRGATLLYRGAGQAAGLATDSVTLTVLGTPDIPAALTDDIDLSTELADATAIKLAEMIKGGMSA